MLPLHSPEKVFWRSKHCFDHRRLLVSKLPVLIYWPFEKLTNHLWYTSFQNVSQSKLSFQLVFFGTRLPCEYWTYTWSICQIQMMNQETEKNWIGIISVRNGSRCILCIWARTSLHMICLLRITENNYAVACILINTRCINYCNQYQYIYIYQLL